MIIVVEVDTENLVQILNEIISISYSTNKLWKDMNPTIPPPAIDKYLRSLGF